MSGLLDTLNLGSRALSVQSRGLAVAGQNLANVNNAAYTRQRLVVQADGPDASPLDAGNGVSAVAVERVHDAFVERQMLSESSATGSWTARRDALQLAQDRLGENLDSAGAATRSGSSGTGSGLGSEIDGLFAEFQGLTTEPDSLARRGVVLARAQALATGLNQADARLSALENALDQDVTDQVQEANELLASVADLGTRIFRSETLHGTQANDLRDLRQQKLESLAGLVGIETVEDPDGALNISVGGQLLVTRNAVTDTLVAVDGADGRRTVATAAGGALSPTSGSLHGTLEARDGALANVRTRLDSLAGALASEVNAVHRTGFDLTGGTGADFFVGTTAATLQVHPDLVADPARLQAAGKAGAPGDNQVARSLAALAQRAIPALGGQTFTSQYARTVAGLGEDLATAKAEVEDQQIIRNALQVRRDSISGVSIDEEMADLVKYQKAFQASARVMALVDGMLDEVLNMIR